MFSVCLIVDIFNECMNRGTDVGKGLTYLLATGNIATKSGLGLMQVNVTTLHGFSNCCEVFFCAFCSSALLGIVKVFNCRMSKHCRESH